MNQRKKNKNQLTKYFNNLYHILPHLQPVRVESRIDYFPFFVIDINHERYIDCQTVGYSVSSVRDTPDPIRRFLMCQGRRSRSNLFIKLEQVIQDLFDPGTFFADKINEKLFYKHIVSRFKIEDLEKIRSVDNIPNIELSTEEIDLCHQVFDERIRVLNERKKEIPITYSFIPFSIPNDFIDIIERICNFVKEHPDESAETHRVFDSTLHILESIKI